MDGSGAPCAAYRDISGQSGVIAKAFDGLRAGSCQRPDAGLACGAATPSGDARSFDKSPLCSLCKSPRRARAGSVAGNANRAKQGLREKLIGHLDFVVAEITAPMVNTL